MMGPSCRRRTRTRRSSSRRKTLLKNHPENPSDRENSPENSPVKPSTELELNEEMCSTPKAERHRIPEIQTCPPAPKKRRMSSSSSTTSCSLRRTSIAFFAPPDIEIFFNFALRGIPV